MQVPVELLCLADDMFAQSWRRATVENPQEMLGYVVLRLEMLGIKYASDPQDVTVARSNPIQNAYFMAELGYLICQQLSMRSQGSDVLQKLIELCEKHFLLDPRRERMECTLAW